uniref:UDP-glycosyltransferase n=2 Tax=Timema TaxID=61471 RepID=A0A7R9DF02_TIMPO|nr:unnamed protein product [Timema poppensis]
MYFFVVVPEMLYFPVLIPLLVGVTSCARILAIFPHIGKSHFDVFQPYLKQLSLRGHHVVVMSHFPQRSPSANYTDISLEGSFSELRPTETFSLKDFENHGVVRETLYLGKLGRETCEQVLSLDVTQRLIRSDERFDLVIYELFNTDCFLGFVDKFQAPSIAVSSSVLMPWGCDRVGNPDNPAFVSYGVGHYGDRMVFAERLVNAVHLVMYKVMYYLFYEVPGDRIARKYFKDSLPPLVELAHRTSLVLVNTHFSLNRPRPLVPNIVEVGGIHLRKREKLPQVFCLTTGPFLLRILDKFISEAKHGVVYFSMGSMIRAETFPEEKRRAFLEAFSELPQRVLWKWEGGELPDQPSNVLTQKWMPQLDILCNSPMASLVLTDSSQLTDDGFEKLPGQIMYPYAELYDL